jgi:hypothetical protein
MARESNEETNMKVEGQWHCGELSFEAEIDPETVRICHCTDCQTITGAAYRVNVTATAEHFRRSAPDPCCLDQCPQYVGGAAPVDTFQKHRQLRRRDHRCTVRSLRPDESPVTRPLREQAQSIPLTSYLLPKHQCKTDQDNRHATQALHGQGIAQEHVIHRRRDGRNQVK